MFQWVQSATTSCQATQQAKGGKTETVVGTLESQMDGVSSSVRDANEFPDRVVCDELLRR